MCPILDAWRESSRARRDCRLARGAGPGHSVVWEQGRRLAIRRLTVVTHGNAFLHNNRDLSGRCMPSAGPLGAGAWLEQARPTESYRTERKAPTMGQEQTCGTTASEKVAR